MLYLAGPGLGAPQFVSGFEAAVLWCIDTVLGKSSSWSAPVYNCTLMIQNGQALHRWSLLQLAAAIPSEVFRPLISRGTYTNIVWLCTKAGSIAIFLSRRGLYCASLLRIVVLALSCNEETVCLKSRGSKRVPVSKELSANKKFAFETISGSGGSQDSKLRQYWRRPYLKTCALARCTHMLRNTRTCLSLFSFWRHSALVMHIL